MVLIQGIIVGSILCFLSLLVINAVIKKVINIRSFGWCLNRSNIYLYSIINNAIFIEHLKFQLEIEFMSPQLKRIVFSGLTGVSEVRQLSNGIVPTDSIVCYCYSLHNSISKDRRDPRE